MNKIDTHKLLKRIREVFIEKDKYELRFLVEEFYKDDEFRADYFNYLMYEDEGSSPTIYHVATPYDVVSKKAPQQALVWKSGELVLNLDYTEYADVKTAALDAMLLQELGVNSLESSKILFFGAGKIAKWAIKILKDVYQDLKSIDYKNASNGSDEFEKYCEINGVDANLAEKINFAKYDFIFCHTNANSSVIDISEIINLKSSAIIASFRKSPEGDELAEEFFDSDKFNLIVDWGEKARKKLKEESVKGIVNIESLITLNDLIEEKGLIDNSKPTHFHSFGTPMQNLAMLKLLLEER